MAEAGPEPELLMPRRDSRVRIAVQEPVVISAEGGDEWCAPPADFDALCSSSSSSSSSEEGPDASYELDPGLESSEEELERLTSRNTVRNSFSQEKDSEEGLPTVHYCQYDKKEPPPPKNNGTIPPYKVVELPPPSKVKSRPPPRPAQPPDSTRRSLPPPPASPPPPVPRGAIVVPPPPDTPPPPTPSSRTKAPAVTKDPDGPIDLPKIVYEEKEGVKNTNFVPIMYASSQQAAAGERRASDENKRAPSGGFMLKVGKIQKGMKHLRKRLTSPESHEPPRGPPGNNWKAARELPPPPPPDSDPPSGEHANANEEADEERRSRQIVTQKNVRPPKPPPPSRPLDLNSNRPKPKPRLAGGLKDKICDLEDLTCLDSLFPFLSSFLLLAEEAPAPPPVPSAVLDLSAQNFLLTWSERWRRRAEKEAARAKVDGPYQLGECALQGRKFAVFEGGAEGEKLLAVPPEQISPPAFSFSPPRSPLPWRPARSEGPVLVSVSCCCPLDRLLALLDAADEPVAPLKRCLALAALVLALTSGLPPSLPPSQVLVLLSRHDLRFLLPEPMPPSSDPPALPPPSPLERLAPHMVSPGEEVADLAVALAAFRGAILFGKTEAASWRREAGSLLLPRLFTRFERADVFAPFLAGLLIVGEPPLLL